MRRSFAAAALLAVSVAACGGSGAAPSSPSPSPAAPAAPSPPQPTPTPVPTTWDVDARGVPVFITADYIDLDAVSRISRFRSGQGHDYSDAVETCRSMKHYFVPHSSRDWSTLVIRAPLDGEVDYVRPEWAGVQVGIRSRDQPAFVVILFHVTPTVPLDAGTVLTSGQVIGTHVGNQTWSDVAIRVETPTGMRLVSWFEAATPGLLDRYRGRGVSKDAIIISRAERDAHPLSCGSDGGFLDRGALPHWVDLR